MKEKDTFVLFDFDGVIADTEHIAIEVQQEVCPDFTRADNRIKFERNVFEWWDDPTAYKHTERCRHERIHEWETLYRERFEKEAHPFPGSIRAVQDTAEKHMLSVVSSTLSADIHAFLSRYDAAHYFSDIFGHDVHKSKVEKINMLLSRYSIPVTHAVFVTDTLGDIHEATKTGIGTIGVSWGFHEHERLAKGSPFRIVDHPHELPAAVDEYFSSLPSPVQSAI